MVIQIKDRILDTIIIVVVQEPFEDEIVDQVVDPFMVVLTA